jgi:hypothetical protein
MPVVVDGVIVGGRWRRIWWYVFGVPMSARARGQPRRRRVLTEPRSPRRSLAVPFHSMQRTTRRRSFEIIVRTGRTVRTIPPLIIASSAVATGSASSTVSMACSRLLRYTVSTVPAGHRAVSHALAHKAASSIRGSPCRLVPGSSRSPWAARYRWHRSGMFQGTCRGSFACDRSTAATGRRQCVHSPGTSLSNANSPRGDAGAPVIEFHRGGSMHRDRTQATHAQGSLGRGGREPATASSVLGFSPGLSSGVWG